MPLTHILEEIMRERERKRERVKNSEFTLIEDISTIPKLCN